MTYQYKGYEIKKVTKNDYVVTKNGEYIETMTAGNIPRTLKAAKAHIDSLNK